MSFLRKITTIALCTSGINYYNLSSATHINNNYYNNNIKHHKSHYKTIKYQDNKIKSSNYYNKKVMDWNNSYKQLMRGHDNFVENSITDGFMNEVGNDTLKYINENIQHTIDNKIVISNNNKVNFKLLKKIFDNQIAIMNDCNKYCMYYSIHHEFFDIIVNELVHYHEALYDIFNFYFLENFMFYNKPYQNRIPEIFYNTVDQFFEASYDFYNKIITFRYLTERYNKQLFRISEIFSSHFTIRCFLGFCSMYRR